MGKRRIAGGWIKMQLRWRCVAFGGMAQAGMSKSSKKGKVRENHPKGVACEPRLRHRATDIPPKHGSPMD